MAVFIMKYCVVFVSERFVLRNLRAFSLLVIVLFLLAGCGLFIPRPPEVPPPLVTIKSHEVPLFEDDLNGDFLALAIERSLEYYNRLPEEKLYRFGNDVYTAREMKESFVLFLEILKMPGSDELKRRKIEETFEIYRATGRSGGGDVLFTGYYAPVLEGSLEETPLYRYPLYRTPDDHIVINLGRFKPKYEGERLIARVLDGEAFPYHTRKDIDRDDRLKGRGLDIAWLADPVDAFFLHIQGSGIIHLRDGSYMNVSYAQSNGHPYRSVGRLLMDERKLAIGEVSMRGIKTYLNDHPDEMFQILGHNESYVFFRIVESGPVGCLNVPVTQGRTIATDGEFFPKGALAFIRVRKPILDEQGNIESWTPFSRFVLNQDAGGAIKGPGRVDLYCGQDEYAEVMAGHMKEEGDLYFLVKKK
ncbi:MAG: murein transglycosylase [Syntrophobacterales bacterium]|nr:MAG: murein transglycosylase [Syntrophobacterales bacterium]